MPVEKPAVHKGGLKGPQQILFPTAQFQGILWIHGGKVHIHHGIRLTVNVHCSFFIVHIGQHHTVIHLIFRVAPYHGALHLKLDNSNGLVHLGCQAGVHCVINILVQDFGHEPGTGVILVYLGREHGQGAQVDAVAVLQYVKTVVADCNAQHIADTCQIACRGSHPGNIMVPPLHVHIMETHQLIHDDIRPWAPVIYVPNNMQIINGKVLDQMTQRNDELVRNTVINDGMDDFIIV